MDPNNPDRVFFDTFDVWFATRTGTVWNDITCGYSGGNPRPVHVDQHALAFVPGSSSILTVGNDGGVHGTTNADAVNQTTDPTWFNMDTDINTIEFYSGDISGNFANAASPQASRWIAGQWLQLGYVCRHANRAGAMADRRWRRWLLRAD